MAKNLMAKTRPAENPYEVYKASGGWTWKVLKKWQADDSKPFARWFCLVSSPYVPDGELGDCYAADVLQHAIKTFPIEEN